MGNLKAWLNAETTATRADFMVAGAAGAVAYAVTLTLWLLIERALIS